MIMTSFNARIWLCVCFMLLLIEVIVYLLIAKEFLFPVWGDRALGVERVHDRVEAKHGAYAGIERPVDVAIRCDAVDLCHLTLLQFNALLEWVFPTVVLAWKENLQRPSPRQQAARLDFRQDR